MASLNVNVQTVAITTAVGTLVVLGAYLYQRKKKNVLPIVWEPVGKVTELYIYPLKSARRVKIETACCTDYGFQLKSTPNLRDRCLVVYKEENNENTTARDYPKLLLVSVAADDQGNFSFTAPGMDKLQIKVPSKTSKLDEIGMPLEEKIFMTDCGDDAARWISRYLLDESSGLRLGYHNGLHRRDFNKTHKDFLKAYTKLNNSATGMYSALTSYLLMNQLSLNDLVSKAPDADITMHNFRPNIVVDGDKITPFCEDNWDWVKIGPVILRNVKPCTRCVLTTIHPETTITSVEEEPLTTLKTYRQLKDLTNSEFQGNLPVMGINMGLVCGGDISVGDTVYLGKK